MMKGQLPTVDATESATRSPSVLELSEVSFSLLMASTLRWVNVAIDAVGFIAGPMGIRFASLARNGARPFRLVRRPATQRPRGRAKACQALPSTRRPAHR